MKKSVLFMTLSALLAFTVMLGTTGCKKTDLSKLVEEINENCPQDNGMFTLTKVAIENNCLTYYEEASKENFEALDEDAKREELIKGIQGDNKNVVTEIVRANKGLAYVYYESSDSTMENTKTVQFEPSELGNLIKE